MLRKLTMQRRSLDDFCKQIFAGADGNVAEVKTYDFDDVVAALNDLAPWNWQSFLRERLDATDGDLPSRAIESAGWRLIYNAVQNPIQDASEHAGKKVDLTFSIGAVLDSDGVFRDVVPGMSANRAGIGPEMKVRTINHRQWSPTAMRVAVQTSQLTTKPIEVEIVYGKILRTYRIDYHGDARYPHLERRAEEPDRLEGITSARAAK
jgi:predicted metalloprotease with PDZ domain